MDIYEGRQPVLVNFEGQDDTLPSHISGIYFEGSGKSGDPYLIKTAADLALLAELVNEGTSPYADEFKYYRLENDIDLSEYQEGEGWTPIGTYNDSENSNSFKGMFDGNNKVITGLYINRDADYQGLFGYNESGKVYNLGVINADITGKDHIGIIAGGLSYSIVENSYSTGSVSGDSYVGGTAGILYFGTVRNSYSTGSVSGSSYVGGIAGGIFYNSTVRNCYSTGNVSGSSDYVGGVVGGISDSKLQNCAALNSSISGTSAGRVTGHAIDAMLLNNYAFSGIPGTWTNKSFDGQDGADVSVSQLSSSSFWTEYDKWDIEYLWDERDWDFEDYKLPVLKNLAGQNGAGGLCLMIRDIQNANITADEESFTYNGHKQQPNLTVIFDNVILIEDTDYTAAITSIDADGTSAGTNPGNVTMTITGIGNFTGTQQFDYTIHKIKVQSINTSISNMTMTAYDAFGASNPSEIVAVANLPTEVSAAFDGGEAILPITWATSTPYNIKGTEYVVTGTLQGSSYIDSNDKTLSMTINVAAVTATKPVLDEIQVIRNSDPSATAGELGETVLPISGSIPVNDDVSAGYTIQWDESISLDRTRAGNEQTFTGTITYTDAPEWLTLPGDLTVSRRVKVEAGAGALYTVNFDLNGGTRTGGGELTQTVPEGGAAAAPAVFRSGYTFMGWDKAFDNVTSDLTVTANWKENSSTGGSSGGSNTPPLVTQINNGSSTTGSNIQRLVSEEKTLTVVDEDKGARLVFDTDALKGISGQATDDIIVKIEDVSDEHHESHHGKTVFSLTVTSGNSTVSNFGGSVTVSLPYELKEGERAEDVSVWHIANDGTMTEIPCTYDPVTKLATFTVTHFSLYVVGVPSAESWVNPFKDVDETDWFYEAVKFTQQRGLFTGTGADTFSPGVSMTRGMFVTVLAKLDGADLSGYTGSGFTDVDMGKYYGAAAAWASENGIAAGHGNGLFAPEDSITREQMAVMLDNYIRIRNIKLAAARPEAVQYADDSQISSWARDAVYMMQAYGLMVGGSGNLFEPGNITTRAAAAQVFMNFVNAAEQAIL